jgi:hypothetical protein
MKIREHPTAENSQLGINPAVQRLPSRAPTIDRIMARVNWVETTGHGSSGVTRNEWDCEFIVKSGDGLIDCNDNQPNATLPT